MQRLDRDLTIKLINAMRRGGGNRGTSVLKIAVALGATPNTVYSWLRGERSPALNRKKALIALARKLGVSEALIEEVGAVRGKGMLDDELVRMTLQGARRRGARVVDLIAHFKMSGTTLRNWENGHGCPEVRREQMIALCERYGMNAVRAEWDNA